jgi:glycosyltransferase involved in cell wall biosynthesis
VSLGLNYEFKRIPIETATARLGHLPAIDLSRPFALHVGSNLRRKNRDGVLRIISRVKDTWNGRIVFAGEPLSRELRRLANELEIVDRVVEVPGPDDETLEALYNTALALLYPSRFEGFGWPIIEAQACGCPVICSNSGPLPEVAGEAGLLHPTADEAGFANDLLRLSDAAERQKWSEKSVANAARFSTPEMIKQYLAIYRRLGATV